MLYEQIYLDLILFSNLQVNRIVLSEIAVHGWNIQEKTYCIVISLTCYKSILDFQFITGLQVVKKRRMNLEELRCRFVGSENKMNSHGQRNIYLKERTSI